MGRHSRAWLSPRLGAAAASVLLLATPCSAQLTRLSTIPPVADIRQGDALVGIGVSHAMEQEFPLSGLEGDLLVLGRLTAAYAIADRAVLKLDWEAARLLWTDGAGPSAVSLRDDVADGHTSDTGDVRFELTYAPFTLGSDVSFGGWVAVELPNSDQTRGIGSNTTNTLIGAVISTSRERVTLTGRIGLGILESPLSSFTQDDVIVYGFDALVQAADGLRLVFSVDGWTNPRRTVSLGLEDRGVVKAGVELGSGRWRLDAGLERGFARRSPDWQAAAGVSWVTRAEPGD